MKKTLLVLAILVSSVCFGQIDKSPVNVGSPKNGLQLKRLYITFEGNRELEYIKVVYSQWKQSTEDTTNEKLSYKIKTYYIKDMPAITEMVNDTTYGEDSLMILTPREVTVTAAFPRFTSWYNTTSLSGMGLGNYIVYTINYVLGRLPDEIETEYTIKATDLQ